MFASLKVFATTNKKARGDKTIQPQSWREINELGDLTWSTSNLTTSCMGVSRHCALAQSARQARTRFGQGNKRSISAGLSRPQWVLDIPRPYWKTPTHS